MNCMGPGLSAGSKMRWARYCRNCKKRYGRFFRDLTTPQKERLAREARQPLKPAYETVVQMLCRYSMECTRANDEADLAMKRWGEKLNSEGGFDLMRLVWSRVLIKGGEAARLKGSWDGIGEWEFKDGFERRAQREARLPQETEDLLDALCADIAPSQTADVKARESYIMSLLIRHRLAAFQALEEDGLVEPNRSVQYQLTKKGRALGEKRKRSR